MFFVFLGAVGAVVGWIVGVNLNLILQLVTVGAWFIFLNSWFVRKEELGAVVYLIPFIGYVCGMVLADIAFVLKYGFNADSSLIKSITATFWSLVAL